ncbi:MAG: AraC family transcriptional regulator [Verrucomicrobiota bacterium]|nr:AraC family transcriptional regulator [Verrucomicrobiota bacterium]
MLKTLTKAKLFREAINNSNTNCYIRGVGINETMKPGIINRPKGTGDWLLMYFHDSVIIKSSEGTVEHSGGSWIIWSDLDGHYYGVPDKKWVHSWIHFEEKSVESLIADCGLKTNHVMRLNSPNIVENSLSLIYLELIEQAEPDHLILKNLLHNLFRRLSRSLGKRDFRQIPERILRIKNFIEATPCRRLTLTDLAEKAAMSIPHFCAEFKKYVRKSPIEYHIHMKLELAKHLLYDRNLSITEIADRMGYNDIFQFSKQFKKHFGVSPSIIRK